MSDRGLGRSDWSLIAVGGLVEAAVSSLWDEAQGGMGNLLVHPVLYISSSSCVSRFVELLSVLITLTWPVSLMSLMSVQ